MNSKSFRGMTAGAVLVFFLLTCENSGLGNVGLGKVVDTTAPTASVVEPLPSSFIKGDQLFKIKAEDDVGLAKNNPVAIAFVNDLIAYETAIKNGDSTAQDPWIPAFYNEADKLYHVSIDTRAITNSIDGQYSFRIKARDDSGHPPFESSDLVYSVKNGPPMVEMLIPKLDWANIETDPAQAPEVLNSGFLSGVASDLQGVAAGYPLIKLWKDNETEPAEWKVPPVPESNEGGKSFAFRYYTSNDGNVTSDAKEYLTNGLYHVKFQIRDVNGLEVNYPETGSVLINITAAAESPKVTITKLDNQQQNKAFTIRAEVTHSVGVAMGQEGVFEQSATNLTFTKNEIKYGVPWASITSDETQGDRKVVFESYPITPSLSAQALDGAIVIVGEDFTFPDDTYDFDVEAVSIRADRATATYANVTIDTGAPAIEVTNIAPTCTKSDDADNEYVNGKITVDFTATDDNGLGVEADGKRHLKYLVTQTRRTRQTDLDDGLLYDEGEWVDGNPSNGPVVVNSAKRLTVDTTQALYTDGEPLYIYLIAKDKAGNVYSVEKVVNIEQATDEPLFAFTNEQISEFAEFAERGETPYQTTSVMSSANARISGTIEDDDALHVNVEEVEGVEVGGLKLSIWQEEKGKNPAATEKYIFRKGLTGNKSVKFDISLADMSGARNGVGDPLGGGTDSLPEGGYYFTLEMGDLASAKNGLAAVTKETAVYYIAVDMKDPEINVTSPTDNAFVDPTASLTLEGNVVEANIETNVGTNDFILRVSKPHGVGATPGAGDYTKVTPQGDGNWTLTFDEGAVDETNRQITLQAKDRFGKTTEKLLTVRVDGEAPVVDSIKFPVENVGDAVSVVSSTELSINGTAADGPTGSA
ncbi:MAG: hypothetical protein LBG05_06625, partial [Treponema sp.]|nr:hypothetical protein [Treponema sp.]